MAKRKQQHVNQYPDYCTERRQLHSCLRDRDGRIVRPIPGADGVVAVRYELLEVTDFPDIQPNNTGRRVLRATKLYDVGHRVVDENWSGDLYKYCSHCSCQELLSLDNFTSNDRGYRSCLVTEEDAKRYHLKGYSSQPFCHRCKREYVNSSGNKKRTKDQYIESAALSRFRRLLPEYLRDRWRRKYSIDSVFAKFNHSCFKCEESLDLDKRSTYEIDHTLPASLFWNLDSDNCTLLCYNCNQAKTDLWPSMFYSTQQLKELSKMTGYAEGLLGGSPILYPDLVDFFCDEKKFTQHIDAYYAGTSSRRKDVQKIRKRANDTFRKLIDKINKYCYDPMKDNILKTLHKNKNTNPLVEREKH